MKESELKDKIINKTDLSYTHPWIDVFKDFRGVKHIVLWYTNYKGERKFINLTGDQQE